MPSISPSHGRHALPEYLNILPGIFCPVLLKIGSGLRIPEDGLNALYGKGRGSFIMIIHIEIGHHLSGLQMPEHPLQMRQIVKPLDLTSPC